MNQLKIIASFMIPLILGVGLFAFVISNCEQSVNLESFFGIWLIFLPVCTAFVSGRYYSSKPIKVGITIGLFLGALLLIAITLIFPRIFTSLFIALLIAGTMLISIASSWLGAVFWRARKIVAQAKAAKEEETIV